MNLFTFLSFLVLALADNILHEGILYLLTPADTVSNMMYATKLGMEDNQLVLNNNQTTVYYHENGGLSFYANGNYINIDDEKRLVLGDHQDEDFGLEAIPGEINYFKKLSYRMNENFQLCSDNSIRYQSSCDVVRRISIRYEQDWSYETMMRYPLELPPGWFGEDYTAKRLRAHG